MSRAFKVSPGSAIQTIPRRLGNGAAQKPWRGSDFVQHTADPNRQKRRALMEAVGRRQFRKLYRQAKDGHE